LGYTPIYQTNAITKHGEHGNALLTRWPVIKHQHEDMSDHRFEQRGLLHVEVLVHGRLIHVIVVHLGLIKSSRRRQVAQLCTFIQREIPKNVPLLVAGDFNDWGSTSDTVLKAEQLFAFKTNPITTKKLRTYPARLPLVQFDYVFARHLNAKQATVPSGQQWARMSDHLPLIADFVTNE
jgi:endonuclease/exonuclease/phosphatase family metal-dependent hydrolase